MQVTAIKQQQRTAGRYSIFIDGKYAFALNEADVLSARLAVGKEFTAEELVDLKKTAQFGGWYSRCLHYLAVRIRSEYEMRQYLKRKQVPPEEAQRIIDKLYQQHYLDDEAFARSWVEQRRALKKRSNRKLRLELRQKGVADAIITESLAGSQDEESAALRDLIAKKRRLSRYQDRDKLIAYLIRQGYSYSLVLEALDGEG